MRLSRNNLHARADYLQKIILKKTESLNSAPDGSLRISRSNGINQFYCKFAPNEEKYLSKSETGLIKRIAQKDYDKKVLRSAESEIAILNKLLIQYDKGTVEDIYDQLNPVRKSLVEPIFLPDDEFIQNWLAEPYDKATFEEGAPVFLTSNNLRVRSKSEVIFADKYDELGIPFKYEVPLFLRGYGRVRPDFAVLDVKLRRVIYHEHFGRMDDPEYAEKNIKKLKAYLDNGFVLGKTLLITMETKGTPITPIDAERFIRNHFL